jgi:hypothetical protein
VICHRVDSLSLAWNQAPARRTPDDRSRAGLHRVNHGPTPRPQMHLTVEHHLCPVRSGSYPVASISPATDTRPLKAEKREPARCIGLSADADVLRSACHSGSICRAPSESFLGDSHYHFADRLVCEISGGVNLNYGNPFRSLRLVRSGFCQALLGAFSVSMQQVAVRARLPTMCPLLSILLQCFRFPAFGRKPAVLKRLT